MENIYLDTSIFVKENFLEGKRIATILNLCKKRHFQLVLSIITVKEIKAQFKQKAKIAITAHSELINDKAKKINVLRNIPSAKNILQKFPNINDVCDGFNKKLDFELKKSRALILDYPTLNIGEVFENYFNGSTPFNTTDKKHEFPDAFALAHLEKWCEENKRKCIVFSTDKDFLSFKSAHLSIEKDYEKFLNDYLEQIDPKRKEILSKLFISNSDYIDSEIKKWLTDELDDFTLYYQHTNSLEVHEITIEETNVLDKKYEIISLNEEIIGIEIKADVHVKIILKIDDENSGIYDSENGTMTFLETTELTIDNDLSISLTANFYIVNEDEFDTQCDITEINEGKKIELEVDNWDYY